jgi:hypothetical protein
MMMKKGSDLRKDELHEMSDEVDKGSDMRLGRMKQRLVLVTPIT